MTQLLVSVRDAVEAERALRGGAALIDVKEPAHGSLGAASIDTVRQVAAAVAGRVPLSVALGELRDVAGDAPLPAWPAGVGFAKLGLAGLAERSDWQLGWGRTLVTWPALVTPVAVAYADWQQAGAPSPQAILDVGAALGCGALLLDTFDKSRGRLLDYLSLDALLPIVRAARHRELLVVLAGSLRLEDVDLLLPLAPDYLAVRGAVCHGDRNDTLDEQLVAQWCERLECSRRGRNQAVKSVGQASA
ncbi:MAG: (5-formylfuran-3-yl)methyl phosphate synthase [Planctomycetes bacterium]|nr:(5-formylfuran-3-yl)methyl phosphate synthase [Planctomycetota bacterium]